MSGKDTAVEIQTKFAFYMVALVFTVLALAVETAELGTHRFVATFELLSWLALLASALCGLRRLEIVPRIHSIGELDPGSTEDRKARDETLEKKQTAAMRLYRVHIWGFVGGLVSLLIARAYPGLSTLLCP